MILYNFLEERKRRQTVKLKLPFHTKDHYFYFPESTFWFRVEEVTTGKKLAYDDLARNIRMKSVNDDMVQEQDFPAGTRRWERCNLLVSEWSLEDEEGNRVPVCYEAYMQLPTEWSMFIDDKIFAVNPELRNEPARSNRDEKLEGEVERPSQKAEKA